MTYATPMPCLDTAVCFSHRLSDIIDRLDNDINTLMGAIPVMNNDAVTDFTKLLREDIGTMAANNLLTSNEDQLNDVLRRDFKDKTPLITVKETHDYRGVYETTLSNNFGLLAKNGQKIDLTIHNSNNRYMKSIIIQTDGNKHIQPRRHCDQNDLTINFYSAGKGVKYFMGNHRIKFPSPYITIHRGETHEFGEAGAIPHTGQLNENQDAANIAFIMRNSRKPTIAKLIAA